MKKPGEVTLESEYEKIKKVSTIKFMLSEKTPFIIEGNTSDRVQKLVNFAFGICQVSSAVTVFCHWPRHWWKYSFRPYPPVFLTATIVVSFILSSDWNLYPFKRLSSLNTGCNQHRLDLEYGLLNCGTRIASGTPSTVQWYVGLVRKKSKDKKVKNRSMNTVT